MRATYDPATGKPTCATPGTHFGEMCIRDRGGSWLDRYRPPSTSRFGVTPFKGQAWLGNGATKAVSPPGAFAQAAGQITPESGMTDSDAAVLGNTGSTVPPTAWAQDTATPANPVGRNLYQHTGDGSTPPRGAATPASPSGEPAGVAENTATDEGAGVDLSLIHI